MTPRALFPLAVLAAAGCASEPTPRNAFAPAVTCERTLASRDCYAAPAWRRVVPRCTDTDVVAEVRGTAGERFPDSRVFLTRIREVGADDRARARHCAARVERRTENFHFMPFMVPWLVEQAWSDNRGGQYDDRLRPWDIRYRIQAAGTREDYLVDVDGLPEPERSLDNLLAPEADREIRR